MKEIEARKGKERKGKARKGKERRFLAAASIYSAAEFLQRSNIRDHKYLFRSQFTEVSIFSIAK